MFDILLNNLAKDHMLDREGLTHLLCSTDPSNIQLLMEAADKVRYKYVGNEVHLRGLIEFSNYCKNDCYYCGLRWENKNIKRYRMSPEEIIQTAVQANSLGIKTIVLQSGEDKSYHIDTLCHIIETIKKLDIAVTLSMGEFSRKDYAAMKNAGADRYLLRIETTNRKLYSNMHPCLDIENRIRCLWDLKELGYEVGTGCLVGLPNQTADMLADDLLFFKKLNADMIGIGPFIPCPGTPLYNAKGGSIETTLKMLALTRLLLPDINIPATTALAIKSHEGYSLGLKFGANVIMPNVGIDQYKKLYKIYPGKGEDYIKAQSELNSIKGIIANMGRQVGKGYGGHQKSTIL